jgi:hypothetical protein
MHDDAIAPEQRSALRALKPAAALGFYLAGGTALCLRLGHRRSIDLDLFCDAEFEPEATLRELRTKGVEAQNVRTKPSTLWFDLEGVPASLMRFPYSLMAGPDICCEVPVASLLDIAAMKVEAVASRGARKDFYDLYFICQNLQGLPAVVDAFKTRFASAHPDVLHRLKALTYFDDAEVEPEPILLKPVPWGTVRNYFEAQVRAYWASQ